MAFGKPVRPLAIDLFSGLHGWAEGLVDAGWEVIAVDLEDMCKLLGEPRPPHVHLMLQDVRSLHGSQFKDASLIVSSSPCQDFSYRAMPWTRARKLTGPFLGLKLFHEQFRIQREACEAAGRHIPMVVENVRGAERWVGPARHAFGSYLLWGDVPALMPAPRRRERKVPGFRFDGSGRSFQSASVEGMKGDGGTWFHDAKSAHRVGHSKSPARKAASAKIAKIPLVLSRHIGRVYLPAQEIAA